MQKKLCNMFILVETFPVFILGSHSTIDDTYSYGIWILQLIMLTNFLNENVRIETFIEISSEGCDWWLVITRCDYNDYQF